MIAEIIADGYDVFGKPTFRPRKKRFRYFAPTFPMGRYVSQPLSVHCRTLENIREFLKKCQYVSDREQFGKDDYWMPPEEFEKRRCGDCDDFALWAWRQVMAIGKQDARFVAGVAGRYAEGHAWVTFVDAGKPFLLEATSPSVRKLPRLETTRYFPGISLSWDGTELHYFEHERRRYNPVAREAVPLLFEWSLFWIMTRPLYVRNRVRRFLASRRRRAAQSPTKPAPESRSGR